MEYTETFVQLALFAPNQGIQDIYIENGKMLRFGSVTAGSLNNESIIVYFHNVGIELAEFRCTIADAVIPGYGRGYFYFFGNLDFLYQLDSNRILRLYFDNVYYFVDTDAVIEGDVITNFYFTPHSKIQARCNNDFLNIVYYNDFRQTTKTDNETNPFTDSTIISSK
jgi:hypothetical protein